MKLRSQFAVRFTRLGLSLLLGGALVLAGLSPASVEARQRTKNRPSPRPAAPENRPPSNDRPPVNPGNTNNGGAILKDNAGRVNPNRPPGAGNLNPQARWRNMTPQERQRLRQNEENLQRLSPAQRQVLRDRAQVWQRMTPEQRDHIRNDVLPRWRTMSPDRKQAIQQRLRVLQNMPESARNRRLNDPNFTRGMSEEDQTTLRDLSHLHVGGGPEPPGE